MSNKFEELDDTFNVDADIVEVEPATPEKKIEEIKATSNDIKKDYDYTRGNLYSLIEKGQEAINGILELVQKRSKREHMKLLVN